MPAELVARYCLTFFDVPLVTTHDTRKIRAQSRPNQEQVTGPANRYGLALQAIGIHGDAQVGSAVPVRRHAPGNPGDRLLAVEDLEVEAFGGRGTWVLEPDGSWICKGDGRDCIPGM